MSLYVYCILHADDNLPTVCSSSCFPPPRTSSAIAVSPLHVSSLPVYLGFPFAPCLNTCKLVSEPPPLSSVALSHYQCRTVSLVAEYGLTRLYIPRIRESSCYYIAIVRYHLTARLLTLDRLISCFSYVCILGKLRTWISRDIGISVCLYTVTCNGEPVTAPIA